MKKLFAVLFVSLIWVACENEAADVTVRYEVTDAFADTEVSYLDESGSLVKQWIGFESSEDVWSYNMSVETGEIVYLSAMYEDTASSVKLRILIDGKVYKQGSSANEPEKYLTVSGTVPYD
jgi:hypothetical protein